jgi:hypothetical protein
MEVPIALVVQVERTDSIDHGLDLAFIVGLSGGSLLLHGCDGLGGFHDLVDSPRIKLGVVEVDSGENRAQNGFSLLKSLLKGLDVLRSRVSSPI